MYLTTGSPTHWTSDPNRLPDLLHFFVLIGIATTHIQIESNGDVSSDHTPIIATVSTHILHKPRTHTLVSPLTNWNDFRYYIIAQTRCNVSLQSPDEVDDVVDTLTNLIQEAAYLSTHPTYSGKNSTYPAPLYTRCGNKETGLLLLLISSHVDDEEEGRALTRGLPSTITQRFMHVHWLVRLWPLLEADRVSELCRNNAEC